MSSHEKSVVDLIEDNTFTLITQLHAAVISGSCTPSLIRELLLKDPTLLNTKNISGATPLQLAIAHGDSLENIKQLVKQGADVNAGDYYITPLHVAASRANQHQYKILKILLENGAQVDRRDCISNTPLHRIMKENRVEEKSVHLLLSYGANPNTVDGEENSILKLAVQNHNIPLNIIKMLLEYGANPIDSLWNSFRRLPLAKLFIQYVLIKRIPKNISHNENFSTTGKDILDLKLCEGSIFYNDLVVFRDKCFEELLEMKQGDLGANSVFPFLSHWCCNPKMEEGSVSYWLTKKVLQYLGSNKYLHCKDLFVAALKQKAVLNELNKLTVFAVKPNMFENVYLNSYAVLKIVSFLSREEIINFTVAFMKSSNQSKQHCKKQRLK